MKLSYSPIILVLLLSIQYGPAFCSEEVAYQTVPSEEANSQGDAQEEQTYHGEQPPIITMTEENMSNTELCCAACKNCIYSSTGQGCICLACECLAFGLFFYLVLA